MTDHPLTDDLYEVPPQTDLPKAVLLDRSTLERYKDCPAQGLHCENHPEQTGSIEADAGNEGHDVFSLAIAERLASGGLPWDSDAMEANARMSRPDVQPEVLKAVRPVVRSLSWMLRGNPADVLRFAGGEGDRSGQLAKEILPANPARGIGPTIATCEVDVLMATAAESVQRIVDWKCGRTEYTYTAVRELWQARYYAMVGHANYPNLDRVEFQIVETRKNRWVPPVFFTKRDAADCLGEVLSASEARWQAMHVTPPDTPETWPGETKCLRCPLLMECDHAHHAARKIGQDPSEFCRTTMHLAAMVGARKKLIGKWIDKQGPITWPGGECGRFATESKQKPTIKFRETKP